MPASLARNVASGRIGDAEAEWLSKGFAAWLSARGDLALSLCLRLPTSSKKMARAERDLHLLVAWELIDESQAWRRSVCLAEEIRLFETRIWPVWSRHPQPPSGASSLGIALFNAMCAGAPMPGTVQQVHNICARLDK